jgi:hypothetical protein
MQGYISEPFIAEKEAEVEFSTGQPVRVSYELKDVPPGVMAFPASIFLVKTAKRNGEKTTLSMGFNQRMEAEGVYTFEGVAPGEYELYAYFERSGTSDYIKPWLEDRRAVVVEGGKENVFEARYPTIDKTVEEGDFTIRGRAARSTGTPIANAEVALIPYKEDPETKVIEWLFGGRIHENVRTDDNGNYEFRGVSPDYADFYEVRLIGVDGAGTGASNIRPADWKAGEVVRDFSVRSNFIPQTGHALPDLQIEMLDGSKRKLSDYRGAPVVIHVWARWRPEGPASMPPFVELARANKDGGTQFLALDRNDNWDKWRELVREKKWDDIDNAIMDWDANDSFLNVDVPYSIVLDGEGVVLDHGQGINVERWLPAQTSN